MRKVYITLLLHTACLFVQGQLKPKVDSLVARNVNLRLLLPSSNINDVQKEIQKKITDSFVAVKNVLLSPLSGFAKSPIALNHGEVYYNGNYDNNFLGSRGLLSNGVIDIGGSVLGVPIQIVNRNGNWISETNENFSILFDRDAYLKQLQNSFANKIDKKKILSSISDPLIDLRKGAEQSLRSQISQVNSEYQNILTDDIKTLGDFDQIMNSDMTSIRNRFFQSDAFANLSEQQTLFEQLKARENLGESIDTAQYNLLANNIHKAEAANRLLESVDGLKKRWQSSGLLSRLKDWEVLKQAGWQKALNDPSTIVSLAKSQLNLNSFQRFFLKINKLNLGQSAMNSSSLSFQNFLNNGGVTEFMNKGKSALLLLGKTKDGASITDMPFSNSVFSNSIAKAMQVGKSTKSGDVHISFANFQEGFNTIGNLSGLNQFRQSFVTTISKDFSFGKYGYMSTEVSRSVSSYNSKSTDAETSNLQKLLSKDNLSSNTSFNVSYRDEYPGLGLIYQVHVRKVALGYDNPGNPFLNTGSEEAGLTLRKSFLDKRLQVMVRSDVREFNYNENASDKWRNNYSVFDVKWKLNKASYISFKYLPNRMVRFDDLGKHRATTLDYLSFDGNFNKQIEHSYYSTYASLLYQKNGFASGQLNYEANNIGFVINQSLALKKILLYWNTQLNRSENNSQLVYLNSSLNSEIGTGMTVLKSLSLSTSFSYNAVDAWYKQIGVRETLDVLINQRVSVSGFIDVRKNLALYQPLIFGLVKGAIQVHYNFK